MDSLQPAQRKELIQDLNRAYGLELADHLTAAQLEALLAEKLNTLIRDDFSALVQLLYRIDVNEAKLREVLKVNAGEDAGKIIARLVMERQWQKIETRRQYTTRDTSPDEKSSNTGSAEERW